jgi:hypothetical protein
MQEKNTGDSAMTFNKQLIFGTTFIVLGLGFCTTSFLGNQSLKARETRFESILNDSVATRDNALRRKYNQLLEYNAAVSEALGGPRLVRELRQDTISLPPVPLPDTEIVDIVVDEVAKRLGPTVRFLWRTNDGDYVRVGIPLRQVRYLPDRNATEYAVVFRTEPATYSGMREVDFNNLTQADFQQLILGHVREAVIICPASRSAGSQELC